MDNCFGKIKWAENKIKKTLEIVSVSFFALAYVGQSPNRAHILLFNNRYFENIRNITPAFSN